MRMSPARVKICPFQKGGVMSENDLQPDSASAAHKLIIFIKAFSPVLDRQRRIVLHMIAMEYRGCHRFLSDQATRMLIRYGKDVEQGSEHEFLLAVHELLYAKGEPLVYPDDERPDLILAPDGSILWERTVPGDPSK